MPTGNDKRNKYWQILGIDSQGTLYSFTADPTDGTAPLEVTFMADKAISSAGPIYAIRLDVDGDGVPDQEIVNMTINAQGQPVFTPLVIPQTLTHTYTDPGVYVATVRENYLALLGVGLTDTGFRYDMVVEIFALSAFDQTFRKMWGGMLDALAANDVATALEPISPNVRPKYEAIFTTLLPNFSTIIPQVGDLADGTMISPNLFEYVLVREEQGQSRAYLIYFLRSINGLWYLDQM